MKYRIIYLFVIALMLGSCGSSLKVTADYDGSVDFTQFKTYSYLGWGEKGKNAINDFDRRRIEAAFVHEFKLRGMSYVMEGGDIEVSLFLVTEQKTATEAYTDYYRPYGGYYYGSPWGWGAGYATTTYHQYDYTEGSLICDVFHGKEKKLIWQSVGSGTLSQSVSDRDKAIIQGVKKIMSLYPIPPKK